MAWTRFLKKSDGNWPDPPHVLTLLVSGLSMFLASAAFLVSMLGYRTATSSLEIGQRAYLSISTKRISFFDVDKFPPSVGDVLPAPKPPVVDTNGYTKKGMVVELSISNLGNTPAKVIGVNMTYDGPKEWLVEGKTPMSTKAQRLDLLGGLVDIGPKESVRRLSTIYLAVPGGAPEFQTLETGQEMATQVGRLTIRADVVYQDVFNVPLARENCVHNILGSEQPIPCQETLIDIARQQGQEWLDSHPIQKEPATSDSKP